MGFRAFIQNWLGKRTEEIYPGGFTAVTSSDSLALGVYATKIAINRIAAAISKCELATYRNNERVKNDEWHLWNVSPNVNQTGVEFKRKMIEKLLTKGELLIIESEDRQLFVADDYTYQDKYAFYPNWFESVTVGNYTFANRFYINDVIFLRLNNLNISNWLDTLLNQYNTLLQLSTSKYKRSGGRKGFVKIAATQEGNKEKKEQIDELFSVRFKKYFESENAVLALPKGVDYTPDGSEANKRTASEINDITSLSREIFSRAAQAFSLPLPLMYGENADTKDARQAAITECYMPIIRLIETAIQAKRYRKEELISNTFAAFDIIPLLSVSAADVDKLIACGAANVDEGRTMLGLIPLNTAESKQHFITKNYETLTTMKGGEGDE